MSSKILSKENVTYYNWGESCDGWIFVENEKAREYIQVWAAMFNPSEKIDVFKKHQIAHEFCKELSQKKKN